MKDVLDIGYPLVVLAIAIGLGALGFFARHISERLIRKSMRARGSLSEAEPSPDRPLRQALEAVRATHGG
jgi:hypothetical protein